jgi:hypothetical protein
VFTVPVSATADWPASTVVAWRDVSSMSVSRYCGGGDEVVVVVVVEVGVVVVISEETM